MVDWYNLRQLFHTAIKVLFSSIIGEYADKREMQAALGRGELEYDHSAFSDSMGQQVRRDEIWVDYVADLGDGFNPTYSVAHSIAQETLDVESYRLPRSSILIMGGDQVYPAPVGTEYTDRLRGPYEAAFPKESPSDGDHFLFVIPGNHDWYDGLAQFIKLFCQKRSIGKWKTQQKRSYFAIKLLDNCWLWGIDVQLSADIDHPQLEYFEDVAGKMNVGDNVILCTAEPAWVVHVMKKGNESLRKLEFFSQRYIRDRGFHLAATLTGDLHHYSHYAVEGPEGTGHYVTAGGGGAFMHPTHNLKDRIDLPSGKEAVLQATYPSRRESRRLVFRNLLFPFLNWGNLSFAAGLFGTVYLLTAWLLQSVTENQDGVSYLETLSTVPMQLKNIPMVLQYTIDVLIYAPSVVIVNLIFAAGLYLFTDTTANKGKVNANWLIGLFHVIAQLCAMYTLAWSYSRINLSDKYLNLDSIRTIEHLALSVGELVLAGIVLGGLIFGTYLLITNRFLAMHDNEAFSSMKWQHHKNFLRMHIKKDQLAIYPIGIEKVVTDWQNVGTEENPRFEGSPISYNLIGGQPISIRLKTAPKPATAG